MNNKLQLKKKDRDAIAEFKRDVTRHFQNTKFILYGSKAGKRDSDFSDIDILVLLNRKVTTDIEQQIFGIGFDVGLRHNVVFGIVVEEDSFWNSDLSKAMPFHWMVSKEGILI